MAHRTRRGVSELIYTVTLHDSTTPATELTPEGVLLVLSHAEIERLAHDPRVAGVNRAFLEFCGVTDGPLWEWFGELMFTTEGPEHMRLRRVVQRWFTPRSTERQRAFAQEEIAARLARLQANGGGDLLQALNDVPAVVMCKTLGIGPDRVADVIAISDAVSPAFGFIQPHQIEAAQAATQQLHDLTKEIIDSTALSEDDLIWGLLQELTERETIVMVGSLLFGGHDTTSSQIGCSMLTLLQHPHVWQEITAGACDPLDVVSETMRFTPCIGGIPRTLLADVEINGSTYPAGTLVMLQTGSSSREPGVWEAPDKFRHSRFAEAGCPKVQTFGAGAHYCLGVAMARMVLAECIAQVAEIAPGMHPVEDLAQVPWRTVLASRPERVLVAW